MLKFRVPGGPCHGCKLFESILVGKAGYRYLHLLGEMKPVAWGLLLLPVLNGFSVGLYQT